MTYEGDNFILNLQVCRGALKTYSTLSAATTLSPSSAYFSALSTPFSPLSTSPASWFDHDLLLQLVSLRAALHVKRLERLLKSGKAFGDLSWEAVGASRAIVEAFLVRRMLVAIDDEAEGLLRKGAREEERKVMVDLIHFVRFSCRLLSETRMLTRSRFDNSTSFTLLKLLSLIYSNLESFFPHLRMLRMISFKRVPLNHCEGK